MRKQWVKPERKPMRIALRLDGKHIGKLEPTATRELEVPVETPPAHAEHKPRSVREQVVVTLSGDIFLTPGRHELMLIPENIVDGVLARVRCGVAADQADKLEEQRQDN